MGVLRKRELLQRPPLLNYSDLLVLHQRGLRHSREDRPKERHRATRFGLVLFTVGVDPGHGRHKGARRVHSIQSLPKILSQLLRVILEHPGFYRDSRHLFLQCP